MDAESESISHESSNSREAVQMNNGEALHNVNLPEAFPCVLCRRMYSPDNEVNRLENVNICRDCEVMLYEDLEATISDSRRRRPRRGGRRVRNSRSSESIETLFSEQFSNLINLVRQNQNIVPIPTPEQEPQLVEGDNAARVLQSTSSRNTPSGSRRWWRSLSDNESEGFDNLDSVFGESESNVSYSGYGPFHVESDAISRSAYGGDSDFSVDRPNFLDIDNELFIQPEDESDIDTDTDIDPMHAGLNQWNSDDQDEEDSEWEEANVEENMVENRELEGRIRGALSRSSGESPSDWFRGMQSPETVTLRRLRWTARRSGLTRIPNIFANLEESYLPPYIGNRGDYLDERGFEQLLEQLAETDSSRPGAPPTAASFVKNLPNVIIGEEHEKHDGLVCAVCKDPLSIGTVVNQLPCLHVYHPPCIVPWLNARNSCPLCRYELPTEDKDYEEGKQNTNRRIEFQEIEQEESSDSSSDTSDDNEAEEVCETTEQGELAVVDCGTDSSDRARSRGGWFLFAAAPIASLVGIVLVLCFRNPLGDGREGTRGYCEFHPQGPQQVNITSGSSSSGTISQRENRNRRWWSFF